MSRADCRNCPLQEKLRRRIIQHNAAPFCLSACWIR
ncbi:zinc-finger domain-containing protein [Collimonas pratensis]